MEGGGIMLCYRDITFCDFEDCDKFNKCERAFTDEVSIAAGNWWKSHGGKSIEAPVCLFADRPECFEEVE